MEPARSLQQIHNLVHTYAELVDDADFDGLVALFAHATLTYEGSRHETSGPDAVRRHFTDWVRVHADGTLRTQHLITNVIVELDEAGTTATGRSYYTVVQATDTFPLQPIISGRYRDSYALLDGRWHFTRRHYVSRLQGDLSQHLGRPLEG